MPYPNYTTREIRDLVDSGLGGYYPPGLLEALDLEDALHPPPPDVNTSYTQAAPEAALPTAASIAVGTAPVSTEPASQPGTHDSVEVRFVLFTAANLYGATTAPYTFRKGASRSCGVRTWEQFANWLRRSRAGDPTCLDLDVAKRARGAWVPGQYRDGTGHDMRRDFVSTRLLVADVDAGDPVAVAEALSTYECVIHSTYKHVPSAPRCRVVFLLQDACTSVQAYNAGLAVVARQLEACGFTVPAKDSTCGKLAFLPMHQAHVRPVHIANHGRLLDLASLVPTPASAPANTRIQTAACRPTSLGGVPSRNTTAYAQGALRKATEAVAWASEGTRHNILVKEAASLARPDLGLDDDDILGALLPAAEQADPWTSSEEHIRGIRWGLRVGRRAS